MVEISCEGVLFDLDGVLVDSTPAVERVWSKWALAHGLDPQETVRLAHGRPSIATVRDIFPDADFEAENEIILRGELEDTEGVIPLPGARKLLESLPSDRWALVTSCARPLADVRLKAAGLPIPKNKITCDDVRHGKPDPEPYAKGAALLGVPASRCIVFEDAPAGIRSGKAAGAVVIALRSTSSDPELEEAGADWIISGYSEVELIISDHGSSAMKLLLKNT
ncbi:MAG TPA: HAD family hydrolase [Terriglobales bacterium]|jgi:sugar-phosphatase|nr:HAD family hydrolase [Terriglobales bacterium]